MYIRRMLLRVQATFCSRDHPYPRRDVRQKRTGNRVRRVACVTHSVGGETINRRRGGGVGLHGYYNVEHRSATTYIILNIILLFVTRENTEPNSKLEYLSFVLYNIAYCRSYTEIDCYGFISLLLHTKLGRTH